MSVHREAGEMLSSQENQSLRKVTRKRKVNREKKCTASEDRPVLTVATWMRSLEEHKLESRVRKPDHQQ